MVSYFILAYPPVGATFIQSLDHVKIFQKLPRRKNNSLNLPLYSKAIQLQSRDEINRSLYVFRHGELHVVIALLYAIGKYIQNSGIGQTFIEAGLSGRATLNQILSLEKNNSAF